MKNVISLYAIILMLIPSCAKQASVKFPQGAWQLVQIISNGEVTFTPTSPGRQCKMWSEKNWMFVGDYSEDTIRFYAYGTGTYTLIGNEYEEDIEINFNKLYEGRKVKMTLELVNDTLVQTYHPLDSTGKQIDKESSIEKYIRIK